MWVSNEKCYYEKSLRTKRRAEAIDKAEEMYFDLQNELKDGKKLFSVSIADAVLSIWNTERLMYVQKR